ncbi:MAG TPA: D-sedoheptulose 7-phosphate isomerase [Candidatus Omnitrophota bacterium]|nr:D-sedoheptulose 7-phosphate isomerase [Candidatus Omnitrophota bacterium]
MKEIIEKIFLDSIEVKKATLKNNQGAIQQAALALKKALSNDNKVLLFGNGGSAADSQHIAAELIGRFQKKRKALAAIALTTDTSVLTSLGNDYGFESIFARQIEGLGQKGDVAVGISTSGNSKNVIEAVKKAKEKGLVTIALTGNKGGELAKLSDINIDVPSSNTARVQETHICIGHILCELIEQ